MTDESCPITRQIQVSLEEKQFQEALLLINDSKNYEIIKNKAWDFLPVVCSTLKDDKIHENPQDIVSCEDILLNLVRKGNPKELLLGLLEEADSFKNDECFKVFLKPIQIVLQRVPGKRGKSLEWTLNILHTHVLSLSLPEDYNLEGDEKLLLDITPAVQKTCCVLGSYLEFFQPFVEEVSINVVKTKEFCYMDRILYQREILVKFLLKLLDYPLVYHDLHHVTGKAKSEIRVCCENLLSYLKQMYGNFFSLYKFETKNQKTSYSSDGSSEKYSGCESIEEIDDAVPTLAIANLAYLGIGEGIATDSRPYVYSHTFLFEKHLNFIISLLSKTENLIIFKGLNLSLALLANIFECELHNNCLEIDSFMMFPKILIKIITTCQVKEHQQISVKLLTDYIAKFDWKGRYNLLFSIISYVKHSGLQGLVIGLYKNFLHLSFQCQFIADSFCGKNLKKFLRQALELTEGVRTDILENSDKILSALNLLRYIFLRDQEKNSTGIWDIVQDIKEDFLSPLHSGLTLSKAHYKLQIELPKETDYGSNVINTTVTVGDSLLPNLPPDHQKEVLEQALLTFDVIESVLARVEEFI